jgi:hypothetical protein
MHYTFCPQNSQNSRASAFSAFGYGIFINFDADRFLISDTSIFSDPLPGHSPHRSLQLAQFQFPIFEPNIFKKVKFIDSEVHGLYLHDNLPTLLAMVLHPGLEEFNALEEDGMSLEPNGDGKDCLNGYLLAKQKKNMIALRTRSVLKKVASKKEVDISSLRVGCKYKGEPNRIGADLSPSCPGWLVGCPC